MKKLLLSALILSGIVSKAQFSESFENTTGTPPGWTVINGGDAGTWTNIDLSAAGVLTAQNGVKSFSISFGATAHDDYLVTPSIAVTAGVNDKISFWGRSRDINFPEVINLRVSTTTPTAAAFTATLTPTVAPVSGANYVKFTYDLSAYVGQTIFVGFYSSTTDQFVFDLDNVVNGTTPACIEPTSPLTFSNINSTSANVSWAASTSAPAGGYDIFYSTSAAVPANTATPNTTVGAGLTNAVITGLNSGSRYYVYVRSNCGGGSTSVLGYLGTVTTPSEAPYTNNFDVATTLAGNNFAGTWSLSATAANAQTPNNYLFVNSSTTAATNVFLYSPLIFLTANQSYDLSFFARTTATGASHILNMYYGTAQTPAGQNNTVKAGQAIPFTTGYTKYTFSFTPAVSGSYFIGIQDATPITTASAAMRFDTFSLTKTAVLAVSEDTKQSIKIYPNPVSDILNISASSKKLSSASIYSADGRLVKSFKISSEGSKVNVQDLQPGIYMVSIKDVSGETKTFKVIKK